MKCLTLEGTVKGVLCKRQHFNN